MANPILRGFSKLTQFSGRDTRGEFWPYAGAVFAIAMILGGVAGGLIMSQILATIDPSTVQSGLAAPVAPSDQVLVEVVGPSVPPAFPMPDLTPFFLMQAALVVLNVVLLAAAVSRRLHDSNRSGWWGLMPVPFVLGGVFGMLHLMAPMMSGGVPDFGLFGLIFLNNIAYLVTLVTLIILLVQPSAAGANRHGEARAPAPVRPIEDWSTPS
jgi:uncharacterized membrane protein YhaH (DUF805 family)